MYCTMYCTMYYVLCTIQPASKQVVSQCTVLPTPLHCALCTVNKALLLFKTLQFSSTIKNCAAIRQVSWGRVVEALVEVELQSLHCREMVSRSPGPKPLSDHHPSSSHTVAASIPENTREHRGEHMRTQRGEHKKTFGNKFYSNQLNHPLSQQRESIKN